MGDEIIGQKKLIRDFSAGNKQKIGIVGAMINRPQLLILDEPFNFLDPSSQNCLETATDEPIQQERKATILSCPAITFSILLKSVTDHHSLWKRICTQGPYQ
jgi:ABC-2 type transport system ATP-binding protein